LITAFFPVVSCELSLRNLSDLFNFSLICRRSPGYGVSLVAETTTGCLLSVDVTVSYPSVDEIHEESEKPELTSPEDLGVQAASMLLEEVAQGGVVDSTHQVCLSELCLMLCLMMALYLVMGSAKLRQGSEAFCFLGQFVSSCKFYMACGLIDMKMFFSTIYFSYKLMSSLGLTVLYIYVCPS